MLKRTVSGLMLTLLLIGMLTLTFNVQPARAYGTLYIGSDYTFTSNIYEPVVVTADNITIDGNGYTLEGLEGLPPPKIGFYLEGRSSVTIKNVNIKGWVRGISLEPGCSENTIIHNNITDNGEGIGLWGASYNTIVKNNMTNNGAGIYIDEYCDYNVITQNYIANGYYGIASFWVVSYNKIIKNNITGNAWAAIYLQRSDSDVIAQNNIADNGVGIDLMWSHGDTIDGNNIANNGVGIQLSEAPFNTIYHNNFIDNTLQVYDLAQEYGEFSPTTWDNGYPSGGNYWSDYVGDDLYSGPDQDQPGSDGVGDEPYIIGPGPEPYVTQDVYPLMNPWTPVIASCDSSGVPKDIFNPGDIIYVKGNGYAASTAYDFYIVAHQATWTNGQSIPSRIPGTATTVTSDGSGNIPPTPVWNPPLTNGKYDIVVDVNGNGEYDEGEPSDNTSIYGAGLFVIPEYWMGAILGLAGCFAALGVFRATKRKPKLKF